MKIEITERKQVNALVTGLALVAAQGLSTIVDREGIGRDLSLECDELITYEELVELAEYILETWEGETNG